MTTLPAVSGAQAAAQYRDVGRQMAGMLRLLLFAVGWLLAKSLRLTGTLLGGLLFGIGWTARRAVWPALLWAAAAVKLGWEQGAGPGGRRGPA